LLVGGLGLAKMLSPAFDGWTEGKELMFGAIVVATVAGSYVAARWLSRTKPVAVSI
jgi:high-affinity nickel-transport protein